MKELVLVKEIFIFFFFSSRSRHTRCERDWSSDVCSSDLERYGVSVHQGGTYLATFRAIAKKYPHKSADQILADLVKTTPGDEGKWFAAAKEAGLYDEALEIGRASCRERV